MTLGIIHLSGLIPRLCRCLVRRYISQLRVHSLSPGLSNRSDGKFTPGMLHWKYTGSTPGDIQVRLSASTMPRNLHSKETGSGCSTVDLIIEGARRHPTCALLLASPDKTTLTASSMDDALVTEETGLGGSMVKMRLLGTLWGFIYPGTRQRPWRLLELTDNAGKRQRPRVLPNSTSVQGVTQRHGAVLLDTFVFAIVGGYSNETSTDGMAFLIAPATKFSDVMSSQYMAFLSNTAMSHTFAVELDTYQNDKLRDIDSNHVGIDISAGVYSVESHTTGFYDDRDEAVLTEQAYVGFSAATGPIKTRHYVLAWSFAMNGGPAPPINFNKMPKPPRSDRKNLPTALKSTFPIAASALILAACVAATLHRRGLAYAELREDWKVEFGPHRFSYKDLFNATQGFKTKNLLGAGGFGRVYKGVLPKSKSEVAVKRVSHDSSQGIKEFISEVVSIGHLRHRNLVELLGYSRRKGELLLVYEYMPNGSLETREVVTHRDIKASNVLLDGEMTAHLGDFALARLVQHGRKMLRPRARVLAPRSAPGETVDSRLQGGYDVDEARLVMQYLDGEAPLPELTTADVSLLSMMQEEGSFD
ncbi:L-type lectin-domain containing receptor kinase IV.3 [Dichanthelium oligosanthes]|uniref:non-specific serine/threonine protein kinase n=1 Tax=Dichanthelium oligosanthes TaxID=888268 RepID=A0A1E5UMG3_9POAL|nr:L-type lectin-domain containing receptor kinase IV.3 [Dichanthelium oligosanthes]